MASQVEAGPSSKKPEAGSSSSALPPRQVIIITEEDVNPEKEDGSYPPCNYCNDLFKVDDVMIFDTRQKLSSHAGCYLVMTGSKSTFQIPDMSKLSAAQKSSVFKKAKARLDALEGSIPSRKQAPVALSAEKSSECKSCTRLSSDDFFHGSSKATSLLTQLHHFNILLEDEYVLPSFRSISEEVHRQTLQKIMSAILMAASGASFGTNWTHRSIAVCTALAATRLEALFAARPAAASTEQVMADVDNHLRTLDTHIFLRNLITGVAFEDVKVMARFPIPTSLPDTSFIISPRFIHEKYQEMISFGKKLDPEGTITATLWAIVGVVAATGTQALAKAKIPRKPPAKKATKQTTAEVPAENQVLEGDAETDVIGEKGKSKQPTAKRAKKATRTATSNEAEKDSEEEDHGKRSTVRKSRSSTSSTTITQSTTASKRSSGRGSTSNTKKRKLGDDDEEDTEDKQDARRPRRAAAERAKELIIDGYAATAQGWNYGEEAAPLSPAARAPRAGPSSARVPPSPLQVSNQTRLTYNSPKASPRKDHAYDEDLE